MPKANSSSWSLEPFASVDELQARRSPATATSESGHVPSHRGQIRIRSQGHTTDCHALCLRVEVRAWGNDLRGFGAACWHGCSRAHPRAEVRWRALRAAARADLQ